jgi:mono/diheme cytochrome c family protein
MQVKRIGIAMMATVAFVLLGCSGGGERAAEVDTSQATETAAAAPEAEELGEVDAQLAAKGEALMKSQGCTACHRVGGGRLVGPDLAGVTERRSRAFIVAMITHPDSMLANDADARQLLAEYYTPMANQNVTRDDALALFEYFRLKDSEGDSQ